MKKRELWFGLGMIAGGILFLLAALLLETPLDSLFCGFFGAFTAPGAVQVYKYVKWTKLETADSYQRHLEEEQIELRDERKEMLRNKSGRMAYTLGLLAAAVSMTAFSILGKLGIVEESASRLLILFLAGYMVFQILAGWVLYRLLDKKY
nr:hypothetical protein [uncultured Oscillibacter sp.]